MMEGAFLRLLARYGQPVSVRRGDGSAGDGMAFLQPILDRREDWKQRRPTPLGLARQDRFLYLGEPKLAVAMGDVIACLGVEYLVQAAQPIQVGESLSHWWAVLRVRDRKEDDHGTP